MGSPEVVVEDSLARLAQIVSLSKMGSSQATRDIEFQNEITTYWSFQHGQSFQNLLLLDRPQAASQLFALSDPRRAVPSGQETVWLASNVAALKGHYRRVVGRSAVIRAAETPGFYVKLQTYPDIRTPDPEDLLLWLTPHLQPDDAEQLLAWFELHGTLASRWIVLELPGGRMLQLIASMCARSAYSRSGGKVWLAYSAPPASHRKCTSSGTRPSNCPGRA
jgi:hypothetical protein